MMPMAFVIAIWFSLSVIGQEYLWVVERGKLVAVAVAIALAVNVGLNYWLLPVWGLRGAVLATLVANGVMLAGLWWAMGRHGFPLDLNALLLSLLPVALLVGPGIAIALSTLTAMASPAARQWSAEAWEMIGRRSQRSPVAS